MAITYPFLATGSNITETAFNQTTFVIDRQLSLNSVVNTVTETAHYSTTITGGILGTTRGIRIQCIGDRLNNSVVLTTLNLKVKYGATTIFNGSAINLQISALRGHSLLDVVLQSFGSTGNQRASGVWMLDGVGGGSVSGATVNRTYSGASMDTTGGLPISSIHNSITEDSTVNKTLSITATHGNANANIDHRLHAVLVSLL